MAPTALELLQPLLHELVPVPAVQIGICRICHGAIDPKYSACYQCGFDAGGLGTTEIVPITMSISHELVHHHLRMYKDAPNPEERERLTLRLTALLAVFLANHSSCLGEWDYAVCIPSASRTAMVAVTERTKLLSGRTFERLAVTPGSWSRKFTTDRFRLTESVSGDRILLVEDTYASGASLHSAAAVLRNGGAQVIGPVVLGRHVEPGWPPSQEMLGWLRDRRWDPARCCRCDGEMRDPTALPL